MKFKVSPETAIRCVKFLVQPIVSWPPPLSATKSDLIIRDLMLVVATFCPIFWMWPLYTTVFNSQGDVTRATKNLSIVIAISFAMIKMFMCRFQRAKFQIYFAELDEFIKEATKREREILELYMDKCGLLYTFVGVSAIITATSFCCGPLVLPQPLPADAIIPFEWENSTARFTFLYVTSIIVGIQATSAVIVDIEIAMLLWFSGMRFELLAEEFMEADSMSKFNRCIQRHQKLLESAAEMILTVRYIVLAVAAITTLGNICTGYQFVHHQPIAVLAQFCFMLSVMSMEVLMYAWPADNLMTTGASIADAAYSSQWFDSSQKINSNLQFVILRAQKPLVISISGLLPQLNLDFYGKYLTTSFSYFTTLRAVAG